MIKITKEQLIELYVNQKLTTYKIAEMFDCSPECIQTKLKRQDIKVRTRSEAGKVSYFKGEMQSQYVRIARQDLYNLYIIDRMTTYQIGDMYNCSDVTIQKRLKKFGIKVRPSKDNFKNMKFTGEDNWNFIDGRTPLCERLRKLPESKDWRKAIFERDDYSCQVCDKMGGDLEAHHIIAFSILLDMFLKQYDQFSPVSDKDILVRLAFKYEPFWDVNNGQTLCKDCHNNKMKQTIDEIKKEKESGQHE